MISKTFSRRPRTVDTTHKALVAFAAGILLCLQPVKAAIVGGTNTLEHVPYSTLMWSAADPFGFGAISNLQDAAGLTPQDVTNAIAYNLVPYASHTSNPTIHTTPALVTNIAQYLLLPYSTTADLLGLSNVLSSVDAVFQTGKVSRAEFYTLSTQRVTRVWSADGSQFAETGVVWQASQVTNYTVNLSADFEETTTHTRPEWTNNEYPFVEAVWQGADIGDTLVLTGEFYGMWQSQNDTSFPSILLPVTDAQGTAVVSQHITYVYSALNRFADTNDLTVVSNQTQAVKTDLTTHISTNAASVIAQAQPSTVMRYADFAVTNTDGYAAFTNANPAQKTRIISSPTLGTSLAKARWAVTSTLAGTLSVSAYVQSGVVTPLTSNSAAYAVLTLYTAGGAVVQSNIGATVSIDRGAVSNISATVALAAPATNGYVVAEVFSGTNAVSLVGAVAGGSYPFALSALSSPLAYLTLAQATALFALKDNGTQVNPTMAGTVAMDSRTFAASVDTVTATNGATVSVTYGVFTNGVDFGRCVTYLGTNFWELLK